MTHLIPWGRHTTHGLRREIEDLLDEFDAPLPMRHRIGRLFDDFVSTVKRPFARSERPFVPSLDLTERDDEYLLKVDLPGMREQDIDIRIDDDNVLTIRGARLEESPKHANGYDHTERSYGAFSRSISLPRHIAATKIHASFQNGVLELSIPKAQSESARKIPVSKDAPRVSTASNGSTVQPSKE